VKVAVGVRLRVGVGVGEAVAVQAVVVGKGLKRDCAVSATAVLVPLAFRNASAGLIGLLKAFHMIYNKTTNRPETPSACK
jgi:hypothetical protein